MIESTLYQIISAILNKFDKQRFKSCGKQIIDRTRDGAAEMKECFSWILVLLFCQNRFTQNFVQARVRNKGGGYSEFEPIHTGSEDEGFCRKATLFHFFLNLHSIR